MDYFELERQQSSELDKLNTEIQLEDEMAKASEQMEMQELMQNAYENGADYGKGYSDGFIAGVKFFHEKETAKWAARKEKYERLNPKR